MFKGITPADIIFYHGVLDQDRLIFENDLWLVWFCPQQELHYPISILFKDINGRHILHSEYYWNGEEYLIDTESYRYIADSMKHIKPTFRIDVR